MGYYVNVQAKTGCAAQINELWAQAGHQPALIWTRERIEQEIAHIHANADCEHLRYIRTVQGWNKAFSIHAEDRGQVFIGSIGFDSDELPDEARKLRDQVQFVLDHRFLFSSVTGLADARTALGMAIEADFLDEHGKPGVYEQDSFDKLPKRPTMTVYRLCLEHQRPDLWAAFLQYEAAQTEETWGALRSKTVPWKTPYREHSMGTVWQACEKAATERDGRTTGLLGRFRDGNVPLMFELLRALRPA